MQKPTKEFPEHLRETFNVTPALRFRCTNCDFPVFPHEEKPETWDIGLMFYGDNLYSEVFYIPCPKCKTPVFSAVLTVASPVSIREEVNAQQLSATAPEAKKIHRDRTQELPEPPQVETKPATPPPPPRSSPPPPTPQPQQKQWSAADILAGRHRK